MVLKSVLKTCLYPSAKPGKGGLREPWGWRWIQTKRVVQEEKAEAQLQGLGAGLLLVLCQMGSGPRDKKHVHASRHHLLLSRKRLERCLGSGDTVLFNANPLSTSKGEGSFLHWKQEGQQRKVK